ncbi:hypothetical protein SAMN02745220_04216 [Desulfopila aestuarii DSM 18488]|uniref:Uncharacterized protein n=1 Tax=Desulfopila aestuarii DSM 18488 TaxID=1121416 RepID=A0A1M7YGK4_9BACT|nr:hypothetical protein SAMN02745220_04216 [Desulfopila aestuarii DSM 18488]
MEMACLMLRHKEISVITEVLCEVVIQGCKIETSYILIND